MLIMFLMHRCLWIQEKRCLLVVFLAHLKLVIYLDEFEIFYVTFVLNGLFFSVELAMIMDRLYGGVCYAGIDTDPELKYPVSIIHQSC